jgi:Family of unknown function (DUF5928)/Core-2/I-Branching enzyme
MARIAYILICHKDAPGIIDQARRLTSAGDYVAIHFDGRASQTDFELIRTTLADNPGVAFSKRRHKCGWGEWSLVAATLSAVMTAADAFPSATHFYMLSGDCMPIKSAQYAHALLDQEDCDFIESFDFFKSDWIKTGFKEERLLYRHLFNERQNKRLFYASYELQKRLHLSRKVPADIAVQIGSQWWCLRRRTVEAVLRFCTERRDVVRFFRTTWIPDETFFQTLVRHLVPEPEIRTRTLTFLMFTDYGMPVTFCNDHYDLLLSQDYLFARKISPDAMDLKARLGDLYAADRTTFPISNEGRTLFSFLAGRGRIGRRFGPRFWETESSLGRDRTLLMVICKKWHVAKRLVEQVRQETDLPAVDYLFNEQSCPLPDLGGIQTTLEKRTRHRRALMRMLFDWWQTDTLVCCIDPANFELMQDFAGDKATTRFLEIDCTLTDDYLTGHARRIGLAGDQTPPEVLARLLPTIRHDVKFETDRIRDADFAGLYRIRETASADENAVALQGFLGVPPDQARRLSETPYLFVD